MSDHIETNGTPAPSSPARLPQADAPLEQPAADRSGPNLPGPASAMPAEPVLPAPPLYSQAEPLMAHTPVAGRVPDASLIPTPTPEHHAAFAPEPSSGGYRGLTLAIVVFLVLLLAGAIALIVYLTTSSGAPSLGLDAVAAILPSP